MNSKRLLRVADHLDTVERKDFDLKSNKNCAIGHACRLPYFKRLGLRYDPKEDVFKYKGAIQHCAIAICIGITEVQAEYLFCGNGISSIHKSKKPTPKQVAKALRGFVKNNDQVDRKVRAWA